MASSRRITSTPAVGTRPVSIPPVKPGLTTSVSPLPEDLTDLLDDTVEEVTKRGTLDLVLAIAPNLGDMEAARAHAAEYARRYAEVSGVPEPEPLPDLVGIQARIVDTVRAGIAGVLGRDPFISVVDVGVSIPLPALPEVTTANLSTAPTPTEFLGIAVALVIANNTRQTRLGVSAGTNGPPRDRDVIEASARSAPSPELAVDGSALAAGFSVAVRPSFVVALANTLLTPLSLDGEPCECGPTVLSNPRVTMSGGKMTDRIDATLAGAITATITLVDEVRVTHGARASSLSGRVASTDIAVKPITARAKKLDAESWRVAALAMIKPPHLGRMAVRGILGRLAERNLPALPSPIAMLGAALPFGARPFPPSFDAAGNAVPSSQTVVLGARHLNGTAALAADITDSLRISGLVLLRPRQAEVAIAVQVRDRAHFEFTATVSDVEMIEPSFIWTLAGATLLGNLEGSEVRHALAHGSAPHEALDTVP